MPVAAGTRLGAYEAVRPVGAGGMGEVYAARDTRLGREVAVKLLHGEHTDRFEREARAISWLSHPHVCALYDVGVKSGRPYLVMELLDGKPIAGPLLVDQAVRYGLQIADALIAAHAKGILHRDLKPDNVLLTRSGMMPKASAF